MHLLANNWATTIYERHVFTENIVCHRNVKTCTKSNGELSMRFFEGERKGVDRVSLIMTIVIMGKNGARGAWNVALSPHGPMYCHFLF